MVLNNVSITNVGLHGVLIDDQSSNSDASISLSVRQVTVDRAGVGGFDEDGIRVDEGGYGDIRFRSVSSDFLAAGADGVELDERGPGDVDYTVVNSDFVGNGNYCAFRLSDDPGIVAADDPDGEIEVEVDQLPDFPTQADIEAALGATPAQAECIEIELDGDVWV